jgi:hypothetical protein
MSGIGRTVARNVGHRSCVWLSIAVVLTMLAAASAAVAAQSPILLAHSSNAPVIVTDQSYGPDCSARCPNSLSLDQTPHLSPSPGVGLEYYGHCIQGSAVNTSKFWTPVLMLNSPFGGSASAIAGVTISSSFTVSAGPLSLKSVETYGIGAQINATNGQATGVFQLDTWTTYSTTYSYNTDPPSTPCTQLYVSHVTGTSLTYTTEQLLKIGSPADVGEATSFSLDGYPSVIFSNGFQSTSGSYSTCMEPTGTLPTTSSSLSSQDFSLSVGVSGGSVSVDGVLGFSWSAAKGVASAYEYNFPVNDFWWLSNLDGGSGSTNALAFSAYVCSYATDSLSYDGSNLPASNGALCSVTSTGDGSHTTNSTSAVGSVLYSLTLCSAGTGSLWSTTTPVYEEIEGDSVISPQNSAGFGAPSGNYPVEEGGWVTAPAVTYGVQLNCGNGGVEKADVYGYDTIVVKDVTTGSSEQIYYGQWWNSGTISCSGSGSASSWNPTWHQMGINTSVENPYFTNGDLYVLAMQIGYTALLTVSTYGTGASATANCGLGGTTSTTFFAPTVMWLLL